MMMKMRAENKEQKASYSPFHQFMPACETCVTALTDPLVSDRPRVRPPAAAQRRRDQHLRDDQRGGPPNPAPRRAVSGRAAPKGLGGGVRVPRAARQSP